MTREFEFGARVKLAMDVRRVVMTAHCHTKRVHSSLTEVKAVESAEGWYEWHPGQDRTIKLSGEHAESRGESNRFTIPVHEDGTLPSGMVDPAAQWPGFGFPVEAVPGKYEGYDPELVPPFPSNPWGTHGRPFVRLRRFPMDIQKGILIGKVRRFEGERIESGRGTEDYDPGVLLIRRMVPLVVVALETPGLPVFSLAWAEDLA